jgi:hypothetical protein
MGDPDGNRQIRLAESLAVLLRTSQDRLGSGEVFRTEERMHASALCRLGVYR